MRRFHNSFTTQNELQLEVSKSLIESSISWHFACEHLTGCSLLGCKLAKPSIEPSDEVRYISRKEASIVMQLKSQPHSSMQKFYLLAAAGA